MVGYEMDKVFPFTKHNCIKSVTAMAWKHTVFANDHIQFVVSVLNISLIFSNISASWSYSFILFHSKLQLLEKACFYKLSVPFSGSCGLSVYYSSQLAQTYYWTPVSTPLSVFSLSVWLPSSLTSALTEACISLGSSVMNHHNVGISSSSFTCHITWPRRWSKFSVFSSFYTSCLKSVQEILLNSGCQTPPQERFHCWSSNGFPRPLS